MNRYELMHLYCTLVLISAFLFSHKSSEGISRFSYTAKIFSIVRSNILSLTTEEEKAACGVTTRK